MHNVFLSLGSNEGNRLFYLKKGTAEINNKIGKILAVSDIFESEAWSYIDRNYLNSVIQIETNLSPNNLLFMIFKIEKILDRKKKTTDNNKPLVYSSRTLDIDILFYDQEIIENENLIIPHPLLHKRLFVLRPLNQIAPDLIHPVINESISTLLTDCPDRSRIELYKTSDH